MLPNSLEIVDQQELERHLEQVRETVPDARLGLFGPQSITWQVNRNL